ncbi:MAG: NACHT domain-containing protein [Bacteroidota bacterium]
MKSEIIFDKLNYFMFNEILLKEISKRLTDIIVKSMKNTKIKSYTKEKDIQDSLNQHLIFVDNWSSEVNFSDLKQSKSTQKVFVQLDLYFQPLRVRISESENIEKFELTRIFDYSKKHIALLGQVGSGKTTSLKFFCQSLLYNEGFFSSNPCYPIVIKLNDFNSLSKENEYNKSIIFNELIKVLGIKFDFQNLDEKTIDNFKEIVLIGFLNENSILLLLDGFDEITFKNRRDIVLYEFEKLINNVESSRIVLTSRTSDFKYSFPNLKLYEICPLTDKQIMLFASRWLENEEHANDFINKIKNSPFYDTTIRPLTIAHLCALYERNKNIPEKPKTVYKKIVMLLLEEWNQQRNVHRISKYAKFENDRKFEFLCSLAYNLTLSNNTNTFHKTDLQQVYSKIYQDFDLVREEMITVVEEIESHNGLIIQSGFQKFEFAHKSIQEYLSAEYIVKLPTIPNNRQAVLKLPNEFAIAISISSKPSEYFIEFVQQRIVQMGIGSQFIKPFINRLLLEKVDFNKQMHVAVSALELYSIYIKTVKEENKQMTLFYFDELINEFENFIEQIFKRNDKKDFFDNYVVTDILPSAESQSICVLELKQYGRKGLPKTLYCRKTFITK